MSFSSTHINTDWLASIFWGDNGFVIAYMSHIQKWSSLIATTSICLSHTELYLNVKYSISYVKQCDSLQLSKAMD